MFFDIGALELVVLIILAVLIFGPEKLPKLITDVAGFLRKVREFSESAKNDIRSELGPEFKDFEFEDLNPKTFARKHLLDNDDFGLKEIRNEFDFRQEMAEITDAVKSLESGVSGEPDTAGPDASGRPGEKPGGTAGGKEVSAMSGPTASPGAPAVNDLLVKKDSAGRNDPPPFDPDAT